VPRVAVPEVLRAEPQFRLLFLSQVLSVLGDRVTSVVLPFAVLLVGGDVKDVALVSAAQFLPFAVLALPAGVWADRWDRKRILVVSDTVRLVCQLTVGLTLLSGHASVTLLALAAAVYGAADAFFAPAFTGLLPSTVSPLNLQQANALRGLTFSIGAVAGPVLGGLLVAFVGGPGGALLFDAATFLVSVALLLPLRPRLVADAMREEDPAATTEHFLTSLREGWSAVRDRRWVGAFLTGMAVYHVIVLPAVFVLGPVLADDVLDGARSWAVISAAFGAGCVVGDLIFLRWRPRFALRVSSLLMVGASCQAAIIGSGLGTWGIAALEGVAGICVTGFFTLWETSLQEHVPQRVLSRVSSYDYLVSAGLIPFGNVAAGLASAAFGMQAALFTMSALAVVVSLTIASVPAVRNLPRGVGADEGDVPAPGAGNPPTSP
jgi:MFS family permease